MRLWDVVLDSVFPRVCLGCGTGTAGMRYDAVCDGCFLRIPRNRGLFCNECHAQVPDPSGSCHGRGLYGTAAEGSHGVVRSLLAGYLGHGIRSAAHPLGALMREFARATFPEIPLLIPREDVRGRTRGFDAARLLLECAALTGDGAGSPFAACVILPRPIGTANVIAIAER